MYEVCGVRYESCGKVDEIFGANIETTALCGGLCAERAALSQLRMIDDSARVPLFLMDRSESFFEAVAIVP